MKLFLIVVPNIVSFLFKKTILLNQFKVIGQPLKLPVRGEKF